MTLRQLVATQVHNDAAEREMIEQVVTWLQSDQARQAIHLALLVEPGHMSDNVVEALVALARK